MEVYAVKGSAVQMPAAQFATRCGWCGSRDGLGRGKPLGGLRAPDGVVTWWGHPVCVDAALSGMEQPEHTRPRKAYVSSPATRANAKAYRRRRASA